MIFMLEKRERDVLQHRERAQFRRQSIIMSLGGFPLFEKGLVHSAEQTLKKPFSVILRGYATSPHLFNNTRTMNP
jgi:hypothetical protein